MKGGISMKKWSMMIKGLLGAFCVFAATLANGTASFNYGFQPKEPMNLNTILNSKRH